MKKIISVLLALTLLLSTAAAEGTGILGLAFPDFSATDTKGNTFTLSEALKDHEAVLINIWASWCPPCGVEFPALQEVYEKYSDRVAFISLSCEETDTTEIIEVYRQDHGTTFSMGRDEGLVLYEYISRSGSIPATVIVDRFGNTVLCHEGMFVSAAELTRAIEPFLGDGYTETAVLDEIPRESSTRAFPVSPIRNVIAENEHARQVFFRNDNAMNRLAVFTVNDNTAHLRLELSPKDNPEDVIYYISDPLSTTEVQALLNTERNCYTIDQALPGPEDGPRIAYGVLYDPRTSDLSDAIEVYLIASEDDLDELAEMLSAEGWIRSEEEENTSVPEHSTQAYILHTADQNGEPVPGVYVNFCTDSSCIMRQSDEQGTVTFDGTPDRYHVQILKVPDGYGFDPDFELYTDTAYGEWLLRIRKE